MDTVIRAGAIYFSLLVLMRLTGKRSVAQITPFDFILLLLIGEATQQAMLGDDFSVTNALIAIVTLIVLDLALSLLSDRWTLLGKVVSGTPLVIVEDGQPLLERMRKNRIGIDDVMEEARKLQGIERMEQIKYAVLEKSGGISIIPR